MSDYLQKSLITAAEWLCLAGIFLFTWRFTVVGGLKLYDFFFILSALFLAAAWFQGESILGVFRANPRFFRFTLIAMGGILGGAVLGSLWNVFAAPSWSLYYWAVIAEYGRLIFSLALFWLVAYFSLRDPGFVRRAGIAIMVAPLALWLAFVPALQNVFFGPDVRLRGPGGDPNYLGTWIALALVAALTFYLWRSDRFGRFSLVVGAFLMPLLIWTTSRGAILAGTAGFFVVALHYLMREPSLRRRWIKVALVTAVFILGTWFAFNAPQAVLRGAISDRLVAPISGGHGIALGTDRLGLVLRGAQLFLSAPLGFGPSYYLWRPVGRSPEGEPLGPHNLFLQTALTAGWVGLFSLIFLFWLAGRQLVLLSRNNGPIAAMLLGTCAAMLVASLSLDTLTLRSLWIVAGLLFSL